MLFRDVKALVFCAVVGVAIPILSNDAEIIVAAVEEVQWQTQQQQ